MQKFEYATLVIAAPLGTKLDQKDFHRRLNEYGADGWELVTTFTQESSGITREVTAIFKRPLA